MEGNGPFYLDPKMREHGCCWDTAVVRKCRLGEGMYGKDVALIAECRDEDATFIIDALNTALGKFHEP